MGDARESELGLEQLQKEARLIVRALMQHPDSLTLKELRVSSSRSLLDDAAGRPDPLLLRLGELEPELQWAYWMVERMWHDEAPAPMIAEVGSEAMSVLIKLHGEAFLAAAEESRNKH
jgi:hypothetical protein